MPRLVVRRCSAPRYDRSEACGSPGVFGERPSPAEKASRQSVCPSDKRDVFLPIVERKAVDILYESLHRSVLGQNERVIFDLEVIIGENFGILFSRVIEAPFKSAPAWMQDVADQERMVGGDRQIARRNVFSEGGTNVTTPTLL
jgi:hypothetical protein